MAEGIVSSVLNSVYSMIQSELSNVMSCRQELEDLSSEFEAIKCVLNDAERKRQKDEALSNWLGKLKDVAYEVEDLLDEWNVEALRNEGEANRDPSCLKRACNATLRYLNVEETVDELGFNFKLGREMGQRLKYVRERLERICRQKSNFHLEEGMDRSSNEILERKTASSIDPEKIIGRTPDRKRIIPWLISESSSNANDKLSVIAIVGCGGVGKTALAQLIYNDERVTSHFKENRIWVHVSSRFDEIRICKAIIEAAQGSVAPNYSEWEMVQNHLQEVLKRKQFLLVLDNVWNEDTEKWDNLMLSLRSGANGSRILITCRNEIVTKAIDIYKVHLLEPLFESDSLALFNSIAFKGVDTQDRTELEEIGREIAKKCERLPLIIKRIGRAMHFRRTRREWELVLESDTWDLWNVRRDIALDFQISYDNMPLHLKRCFAFCLMFPKDHVIEKDMLIKLWMAQGFLSSEKSAEMETLGDRYFYDLMRRSLFEDPETDYMGNVSHCKMKDVVHDFFKIVLSECYTINTETPIVPENARHLSFNCGDVLSTTLSTLCRIKNLRTLVFVGWSGIMQLPIDFFKNFRSLRALDLSGTSVRDLSHSFENLRLLRYLNLSATLIQVLPESVCEMFLLQTIKLNECHELRELPKKMCKLTNLRHLEIKGTSNLEALPHGIGRLTSLRTLSKFIVGDGTEKGIRELKDLNFLQGELTIMHLERVPNEDEARKATLRNKKNIRRLELFYYGQSGDKGVFEGLRPHKNIEELQIFGYKGLQFPNWLGDKVFTNLVNVSLVNCDMHSELNALGRLPSLKYLTIEGMDLVTSFVPEYYGTNCSAFRKLEKLVLRRMLSLTVLWIREISSLRELLIVDCSMLPETEIVNDNIWRLEIGSHERSRMSVRYLECEHVEYLSVRGINVHTAILRKLKFLVMKCSEISNLFSKDLPFSYPKGQGRLKLKRKRFDVYPQLHTIHIHDWTDQEWPIPPEMLFNVRQLKLFDCPHLQRQCQRNGGREWRRISHIPNIWFDNRQIQREGQEVAA